MHMSERQTRVRDATRAGQIEMSFNVGANSGDVVERIAMFDGEVREVLVGAPAATNNKVGIQLRYEGEKKLPADRESDFINPANLTHAFQLVFPVEEGGEFKLVYESESGAPHYLNVVLTLVQRRGV